MKVYVVLKCFAVMDGHFGSTDAEVTVEAVTATCPTAGPDGKPFQKPYPAYGEYYRLDEVELGA